MKEEIWNHMIKRLTGQENVSSKKELDSWLAENAENQKKYHEVTSLWEMTGSLKPQETTPLPHPENKTIRKTVKLNIRWTYGIAAACAAVLVSFGVYFLNKKSEPAVSPLVNLTVPKGKIISLTLSDSSTVVLNAGSSIQYPKQFKGQKTRHIKLTGEAFFDIRHQEKQPFIVETGKIKTVVYGTSFNVRAYQNEKEINVSVSSGKVGVLKNEPGQSSKPVFLTKGNSLTFNKKAQQFSAVSMANNIADAWTKGTLSFEQTPMQEVFAALSRKFDVTFDTSALKPSDCKLTARFENKDLKSILKTIHTVMNIQINQTNQTIYLKGGNTCKEN